MRAATYTSAHVVDELASAPHRCATNTDAANSGKVSNPFAEAPSARAPQTLELRLLQARQAIVHRAELVGACLHGDARPDVRQ